MPRQVHDTVYTDTRWNSVVAYIRHQVIQGCGIHHITCLDIHGGIQRRTVETDSASIFDGKVLAYYLLQAEFINSLADTIITEHLHIVSLVIKFRTDISGSSSTDVITGDGVHHYLHACIRCSFYEQVQADIRVTFFLLLYLLLRQFIVGNQIDRIQHSPARCLIHEFDELVAGG